MKKLILALLLSTLIVYPSIPCPVDEGIDSSYNNTNTNTNSSYNSTNTNTDSSYHTNTTNNTSTANTTNNNQITQSSTNQTTDSHNITTQNTTNTTDNSICQNSTSQSTDSHNTTKVSDSYNVATNNNTTNNLGGSGGSSVSNGGSSNATGGTSSVVGGNTNSNSSSNNNNNSNASGGSSSSNSVANGGTSSSSNGNQSTNVRVEGSKDFTLHLPNYMSGGQQSVDINGASNTTSSVGLQGFVSGDGNGGTVSGVLVGLTIPLGNDRAKKAQQIALERAKTASISEKIRIVIELKKAGLVLSDTPETHDLYILFKAIN